MDYAFHPWKDVSGFPLALVTGAAHRLGRTFALTLARQGYAIVLHYHSSKEAAASTEEEIRALGIPVFPIQADLTDPEQIRALFFSIESLEYPLKVLINSAARMSRAELKSVSVEDWDASFNLNLRAPFLLAQYGSQYMIEGGLIVNITDAGVDRTWNSFPAYLVSKAGLESLTRLMAKSFAPGIRVNAIAPGLVLPPSNLSPEEWEKLVNKLPLKRSTSLEEIALALEFLLKNDSVTGQVIVVDGGYSLK